jgi:hypothetical protein
MMHGKSRQADAFASPASTSSSNRSAGALKDQKRQFIKRNRRTSDDIPYLHICHDTHI